MRCFGGTVNENVRQVSFEYTLSSRSPDHNGNCRVSCPCCVIKKGLPPRRCERGTCNMFDNSMEGFGICC